MKLPTIFVPKNKKETDTNKIEISVLSLEDLIPKSINGMSCDEKIITGLTYNYYVYNPDFKYLPKDYPLIDRIAIAKYCKGDNLQRRPDEHTKIVLMEYKKEHELIDTLHELSENINFRWALDRLNKTLLSKNNILVYLDGDKRFIESAADHYKNLGFKQLDDRLKT